MGKKVKVLATSVTVTENAYRDDGVGTNALSVHIKNPNISVKLVGDVVTDLYLNKNQPFVFARDLPLEHIEERDIAFVPVESTPT
jgi:2-hydroxy-3-keto-5-methylthiopentenyl-1-phosphate phosphatase